MLKILVIGLLVLITSCGGDSKNSSSPDQRSPSVARLWNEVLLDAIRNDFARPTVHARNLFHHSALNYDLWALYSNEADTFLAGKTINGFTCELEPFAFPDDIHQAREEAISYASFRLLLHRFDIFRSPAGPQVEVRTEVLMRNLGYDSDNTSIDYQAGGAAELGNYLADCYIRFGLQDGSNEANEYSNQFYSPVNPLIEPEQPGNPNIQDLNRWQQISLTQFIDQGGNPINSTPEFLSAEWGQVESFALTDEELTRFQRDGFEYQVFHNPGSPPLHRGEFSNEYKWGFALVSIWGSHLDPNDGLNIDISPASIGNNPDYPESFNAYDQFYQFMEGGDASRGYDLNPVTSMPYQPQIVPRGDYARVLAEFWADGPESETPPGHWFVILNTVSDHPDLVKQMQGEGQELGPLEWDVKAYFALGSAMHDSAIAAWSIKRLVRLHSAYLSNSCDGRDRAK